MSDLTEEAILPAAAAGSRAPDELTIMLDAMGRIADGLSGIQELVSTLAQRPDLPTFARLRHDDHVVIHDLQQQLERARLAGTIVVAIPTGTLARLLNVIGRLQRKL